MKILFSIILFAGCLSTFGQNFKVEDLQRLKQYCRGDFAADSSLASIAGHHALTVKPFWEKRKDGLWLLAKQAIIANETTEETFFVWHFYVESKKVLPLQFLYFKDSVKAQDLFAGKIKDESVLLQDLTVMNSCEIYLVKEKNSTYKGKTRGKDCFRNNISADYLIYSASFSKKGITLGETGFDNNEKHVWGNSIPNEYKKIASSFSVKK